MGCNSSEHALIHGLQRASHKTARARTHTALQFDTHKPSILHARARTRTTRARLRLRGAAHHTTHRVSYSPTIWPHTRMHTVHTHMYRLHVIDRFAVLVSA